MRYAHLVRDIYFVCDIFAMQMRYALCALNVPQAHFQMLLALSNA